MKPGRAGRALNGPWRAIAIVGGVAVALLVVIGVFAAVRLAAIAGDLRRARTMIVSASADIEQGRLGQARDSLAQAEQILSGSNGDLYGAPELDAVSWLPVFSDNLSALRRSVGLALQMVDGGGRLLDVTRPLENADGHIEVTLNHGAIPLDAVKAAQQEARNLADVLPTAGEKPGGTFLLGSVSDLQEKVYSEAGKRRAQLDSVSRALSFLTDLSGGNGPRTYLIAVANPAEMRGAGGMILSYGILTSANGTFTLGNFGNIDEGALDAPVDPASIPLPQDFLARWDGLQPTLLWRNTTLAPDFRFDAAIMEKMFTAKTGQKVNGIIQIDPQGLAAILAGTGPVDVDGLGQVSAENVVDLTINQAYIEFPDRNQRQELLGDVAKAAFTALVNGDFTSLRPFGEALSAAAQGRHLIFATDDQAVEQDAAFFQADGRMPGADFADYALLTVQNFSKNKLDYYVDTSLSMAGQRPVGREGQMTATITITNSTPEGVRSEYVTGPQARGQPYAEYKGAVSLYVPTGTTLAGATGADPAPFLTTEAGRTVISYDVVLAAGESSTVTLDLRFVPRPRGAPYQMLFVPVPRVRPTVVAADIDTGDGRRISVAPTPLDHPFAMGPR